jgi:hypothetical protein
MVRTVQVVAAEAAIDVPSNPGWISTRSGKHIKI